MSDRLSSEPPREVYVGEVARQLRAATNTEGQFNDTFLGLEHIESETGRIVGSSSMSTVRSRGNHFQAGDVLYGRMRPHLRKVAVAEFPGSASGEIVVLRCSDQITPQFLRTILLSEHFTQYALSRTRGDRPRVSARDVSEYRFELPPLEVQERIAARDELALLLRAESRRHCDDALGAATRAMEEVREHLIWGPSNFTRISFGELFENISYGTSTRSEYRSDGIPVLRIPNIKRSGVIDSSDLKYAPLSPVDVSKYALEAGDLLFIRSNGSAGLVGRAAVVDPPHEGFAFAGYLLRARPKDRASSMFLRHLTQTKSFRVLVSAATKSTAGINNLSGGRLSRFVVPFPDEADRVKIAEELSRLELATAAAKSCVDMAHGAGARAHMAARQSWLRQTGAPSSTKDEVLEERAVVLKRQQPDPPEVGSVSPRDSVIRRLGEFQAPINFMDLFDVDGEAYDRMRDAVFEMLAEVNPLITQYFDEEQGRLLLKRIP